MWACYKGHSMVVQELLDHDANPNVKAEVCIDCIAFTIFVIFYLENSTDYKHCI